MDNRELLKVVEKAMEILESKREKIKNQIKKEEIEKWKKRKNEGWIPFVLKMPSSYEDDDGGSIIVDYYAFAPSTVINKLETLETLENFLKSLSNDDYHYFNDETIFQAVWPEKYITNE
jgi:C4-type Zn-finger protein